MANLIPLAIADFETSLSTAISAGATSLTLSSATDDDGEALPAGKYCFTVNNGSSNKQYLIGQLNGTEVTSVYNVSRQGVETSGAAFAARAGSPIIISDFATIQRVADILRGQLALDGANPIIYDAEPTLADRKELATVGYVLDAAFGGSLAFDNMTVAGNAGEAIVAGNLVYFNTSDQEWYKTDADTAATVDGVQLGIALGTGSDGVAITGGIQIAGTYTTSALTPGALQYASNTAGALSESAGTTTRVIGLALSATKLLIIPQNPESLTSAKIAALAGDATPTSVNKFLTKGKAMVAGATINGATTPVPVYQNKTDNEFYACDANDTAAMKFIGFAISNGTDGTAMNVQFTGIVSGFTGLSEGEKYYVQDAVGTIGTTVGTHEILVGVAISETELLIQKGRRVYHGYSTFTNTGSANESGTIETVTTGFRPSVIRFYIKISDDFDQSSVGVWTPNAQSYVTKTVSGTTPYIVTQDRGTNGRIAEFTDSGSGGATTFIQVDTITDTGFNISYQESGDPSNFTFYILWEAEGEL